MALDAIVVNGVMPQRYEAAEIGVLGARTVAAGPGPAPRSRPRSSSTGGRGLSRRNSAVSEEAGAGVSTLPFLFAPSLGRPELDELARLLEGQL